MDRILLIVLLTFTLLNQAFASISITINDTTNHTLLGTIEFKNSPFGLLIIPKLEHIPQGIHGFHIHENPNCSEKGFGAGGHFDPQNTEHHLGPYQSGHLGDLSVLIAGKNNMANLPLLAPRLKEKDLRGHAVIIHEGGDNYADEPEKLGGGGARLGCGVISAGK